MDARDYRRKTIRLWVLIAAAAFCVFWFHKRQMLTGHRMADGTLTVLLGLFICAQPAGNAIDLFFFERRSLHRWIKQGSSLSWLGLNILTLLVGWLLIYLGTDHLTSRPD